ncbi:unnamed protein product [Caretta caretta]
MHREISLLFVCDCDTTGKEISSEVIKCMNDKSGLDFTNWMAICTDGAAAMLLFLKEQLLFLKNLLGDK